jgi:hypothetical protein
MYNPGMTDLHQTTAGESPTQGRPASAESQAPQGAEVLRLQQRVQDALSSIPGGDALATYYGIGGGAPQQSPAEAEACERILQGLQGVSDGTVDLSSLLEPIAEHNQNSGINPDLLRALRRPPKKATD